jgi:Clp amino terminal domain, pathogenicity island component
MFERFTDRARRVVVLAQEEARFLNHDYIGTEHLLLGLVHEGEGVAAQAMESLDISLEAVRAEVEKTVGRGKRPPGGHIPFTPRAKKVLELSLREALDLGHNYIGTEHILLGLIREGQGVAAQVLVELGADLDRARQQVIQLLSGHVAGPGQPPLGPLRVSQQAVTTGVVGGAGVYRDEPADLVRVVPLAREVYRSYAYRVVLISLEVWSGWLDLRYAVLPADPPPGSMPPEIVLDWRVGDDAGTPYELCGLVGSGARLLRVHQVSFMPSPPADARRLTLTAVDADGTMLALVEIELAPG